MSTAVDIKTVDRHKAGIGYRYRIAFLGDPGTGKTSVFHRFFKDCPPPYEESTLAINFAERSVPIIEGGSVKIMGWDTPGNILTLNGTCNHCSRMSAIFFMFDPTIRETYVHIPRWYEAVDSFIDEDCFTCLIAIKSDIIETFPESSVVTVDEAQECADSLGMKYYELNGTDTPQVNEFIAERITEIHERKETGTIDWNKSNKMNKRNKNIQKQGGSNNQTNDCKTGCQQCFPFLFK